MPAPCELSRRGVKEDKGRTEKGRLGLGLGTQTNYGLALKESGQPFKSQGSKGSGLINTRLWIDLAGIRTGHRSKLWLLRPSLLIRGRSPII